MVWIAGGEFAMGSEDFYPEERPVHTVEVDGFWMDEHPVTVAEFRRFVKATDHVTVAEIAPDARDFPDADPEQLVPGSLVFTPPSRRVSLDDFRAWWSWTPSAQWRHPEGPDSTLHGRDLHPVTHVAYADALAYAAWAGKELPTEPEWEFAARGGLDGAVFAWGDDFAPRGRMMANTWQGDFPVQNDLLDGYERTSPVGKFPANGYGLVDMTGNVWEWTCQDFTTSHAERAGARRRQPRGAPAARVAVRSASPAPALVVPGPRQPVAQGRQGRVPPVRAELLPALPAGRPPAADRGHLDQPPGLPLHRPPLTPLLAGQLAGHGDPHPLLGVDEVVVVVVAEVELDPGDLAGEPARVSGVVGRDRGAGLVADVGRLVGREDHRLGELDATGAHGCAVVVQRDAATLGQAAAVVGELHPQLVVA